MKEYIELFKDTIESYLNDRLARAEERNRQEALAEIQLLKGDHHDEHHNNNQTHQTVTASISVSEGTNTKAEEPEETEKPKEEQQA